MPVQTDINALSTTPGSNSPAGSESAALVDDYLRQLSAHIATVRDIASAAVSSSVDATARAAATAAQAEVDALEIIVAGKQATLVSGSNIKTVNGVSLLGSGDLPIAAGASPPPVSVSSPLVLSAAHDGASLHCTGTPAIAIGSGLGATFGCAFYGSFTYSTTSATVTDQRVAGAANPASALIPTPALNSFLLVGSKP
jgi:hypothetical protein